MAALCARFQSRRVPQYLTGTYFTICCALCPRATRSLQGGRPVPAWGWQMLQPSGSDKQGALIVSQQQMRLEITPPGSTFMHPMLDSVQKCDISRSAPGAHKPKLQQGAGGLWSFEGSTFYAAITLWSFQGSILYVPIKSPMSRLISTLFQTALNCN